MKIGEVEPIWRRAICTNKQREEMFDDLDRQIADQFLFRRPKLGVAISHRLGQHTAPKTDVGSIVGHADIGQVWKNDEVIDNDPGLTEFGDSVQLATAENLMAQFHVGMFRFTIIPSRKAWAHKQLAIECIRDRTVQLFLSYWRVRRKVDHRTLSYRFQP